MSWYTHLKQSTSGNNTHTVKILNTIGEDVPWRIKPVGSYFRKHSTVRDESGDIQNIVKELCSHMPQVETLSSEKGCCKSVTAWTYFTTVEPIQVGEECT